MTQDMKQQAPAASLSGTVYILSCPGEGWLKLQLKDMPAPLMAQLIEGFSETLARGSAMMNFAVKVKTREAGEQ
jgi:hypothetical protein